jgi:hypothetical protein
MEQAIPLHYLGTGLITLFGECLAAWNLMTGMLIYYHIKNSINNTIFL